jgi:hypothetical protein
MSRLGGHRNGALCYCRSYYPHLNSASRGTLVPIRDSGADDVASSSQSRELIRATQTAPKLLATL